MVTRLLQLARTSRARLAFAAAVTVLAFSVTYLAFSPHTDVYDAHHVYTPCIHVPAGREHWALPGCSGMSRIGTHQALMRFNSEGIRDREYREWPAKGVYRILVLGSSNTLGPGIEEEATFPRRLEADLRRAGHEVEVINAAMVGYCTIQSSFKLRELLARYSPNLVLYQFVQGTCPLFDGAWAGRVEFSGRTPIRIERSPFDPVGHFSFLNRVLFEHPSLFFLWLTAADQLRKAAFSRSCAAALPSERTRAYLEPTLRFLGYMRDDAREKGADFLVVSYRMKPFTQSIPSQLYPRVARALSVLVRPLEVEQSEIFRLLRGRGFSVFWSQFPTKDHLIKGDVHLSEEGLALLAAETASVIAPGLPARRRAR